MALAHHGLAVFDRTTPITLIGTVTEFHFTNPHCIIDFDVKAGNGRLQKWQGELTSPLHLKGWTATSLEAGNQVKITGYRAKSGAYYVWITRLVSSNGKEIRTNGDNLIPETP
ncbi:MAG: hypothetical protein JO307_20235 [Bryobacterales bacterium]|nr:hypothetical protein [Bryobacterales bacterium]MBV9400644.1 hypothetical protein [Bryobacterales bacterium]